MIAVGDGRRCGVIKKENVVGVGVREKARSACRSQEVREKVNDE